MDKMKILWCGPFLSDTALREKRATNQAAAKWSRGLLRGLESVGCEIRVIDHCTEQRWPKGRVFWQDDDEKWFLDWFPCVRVGYLNVVGLKSLWLSWAYARAVRRVIREWHPDVLMCYNSLHSFNVVAMQTAHKMGLKCVPIILDGDDPRRDGWKKLLRDNRFANGVVFLSHWMYQHYPNRNVPLLHMDGGADCWQGSSPRPRTPNTIYTLVHTGALDFWRGLDFMKRVVSLCTRQDVRFVFCGKCNKTEMQAEFGNDPRVDVRGFVNAQEVNEISCSADVFLNVRTPGIGDNLVNYPSKVPQYLAWGKPVVSTWNDSFSPDYHDVLEVSDDTPEGFVRKLNMTLAWSVEQRHQKYEYIRNWFMKRKSWGCQSGRVQSFIVDILKKC